MREPTPTSELPTSEVPAPEISAPVVAADAGGLIIQVAALPLEVSTLFLAFKPPLHRPTTGTGGLAGRRGWLQRLPQQLRHPDQSLLPVLPLGAFLCHHNPKTALHQA